MKLDRVIAVRNSKTIFRDGDRCIKVFGVAYSKADVLSEALNQARLEETGLPIPSVLEVTKMDGKWAIVTQFVRGKTLSQLMQQQPEEVDEFLALFVKLQLRVYDTVCPTLISMKRKLRTKLSGQFLSSGSLFNSLPEGNCVCHGDFDPSNIILSSDGTAYILDWSKATAGYGPVDAAQTYLQFLLRHEDAIAERYLNLICREANWDSTEVKKWIPLVAEARLDSGNEEEKPRLTAWASGSEKDKEERV